MKGKEGKWIQKGQGKVYRWTKIVISSQIQTYLLIYQKWVPDQPCQWIPLVGLPVLPILCFFPECLDLERLHELSEEGSADMAAASLPEPLTFPQRAPGLRSL